MDMEAELSGRHINDGRTINGRTIRLELGDVGWLDCLGGSFAFSC